MQVKHKTKNKCKINGISLSILKALAEYEFDLL